MRLPAILLTTVYLAAVAVALRDPAEHLLAGAVVLLALLGRLPVTRSAISHVFTLHGVRERRSRPAQPPPTPA